MSDTFVVFENTGELDPRLISTFGCSVKETNNPIGFFGTGLKYALAVLLRNNQRVIIQTGLRTFEPFLVVDVVRGKQFSFVYLDDRTPLGFTTELGKNWELWMAYRELHCNAVDEEGSSVYTSHELSPTPGMTRILVGGQPFMNAHNNRRDFILQDYPDWQVGDCLNVYNRPSDSLFYRGIKVAKLDHPGQLTYNIIEPVTLTEDRTVQSMCDALYKISGAVLRDADPTLLEKVLIVKDQTLEHRLEFYGWMGTPGKHFFPTIKRLQVSSLMSINRSALRYWREKGEGFLDPKRIQLTDMQQESLSRAIKFCKFMGYPVDEDYPIICVERLGGDNVLAIADRMGNQIMLAKAIFSRGGTRLVVRALLEEYIHLKMNLDDCSSGMQHYLFEQLISQAEERIGESL